MWEWVLPICLRVSENLWGRSVKLVETRVRRWSCAVLHTSLASLFSYRSIWIFLFTTYRSNRGSSHSEDSENVLICFPAKGSG
jgi:hypothetical protein